ncbi:MAG: hypothetical protein KDA80_07725, partial [Planctomycetaceae bacterium]|nr:hypothetical protein [Planctomycetaceae bacterium]
DQPQTALAWQSIGLVCCRRYEHDRSISAFQEALKIKPDLILSHNYLSICYNRLGKHQECLGQYEATLRIQPDNPHARFNRALLWLTEGKFHEGWIDYEWRFKTGQTPRPVIPRPQWDGSPIAGKRLMIHTEQGMGDVLQFIRFLPRIKEMGADIVFACQKPLQKLLTRCEGIDDWFPIDEPAPINFDFYTPLLSVPGLLGIDESTCIAEVPYVFPEPQRVEDWKSRVEAIPGFKIGVCWQGSPTYASDRTRSYPLKELAPLANVPGVSLISLQVREGTEQIAAFQELHQLHLLDGLDSSGGAFMDTAAVMQHLDLVISADTAVTHLAGAMGRPAWLALSSCGDWRWMLDREDSPWYPSLRIFRQPQLDDWAGVFQRMANVLRDRVLEDGRSKVDPNKLLPSRTHRTAAPPVLVEVAPGELIDKITILEIKSERIDDPSKLANVRHELQVLREQEDNLLRKSAQLSELKSSLRQINEDLWEIEDNIRDCEREQDFGDKFIQLARSVYRTNDRRAAVKREINLLLGSALVEEKSYHEYAPPV